MVSLPAPFKPAGEPLMSGLGVSRQDRRRRVAVVLLNTGGPDGPDAVRPFLFNLFHDPAILRLPQPLRFLAAHLSARRLAKGGGAGVSSILAGTEAQARALEEALWDEGEVRTFVAMRYWHPRSSETALAVKDWDADELVLLPLRPQFSATFTGSALRDWRRAALAAGLEKPTRTICCFPVEPGFVRGVANLARWGLAAAAAHGTPRLLFSARGLPHRGDGAYGRQCERTAEAIMDALAMPGLDWALCHEPLAGLRTGIGSTVETEIERAGLDRVPLVLVPISSVSGGSGELPGIGRDYRDFALRSGVPHFVAVPEVGTHADFIEGLTNLVRDVRAAASPDEICSRTAGRACPVERRSRPQDQ